MADTEKKNNAPENAAPEPSRTDKADEKKFKANEKKKLKEARRDAKRQGKLEKKRKKREDAEREKLMKGFHMRMIMRYSPRPITIPKLFQEYREGEFIRKLEEFKRKILQEKPGGIDSLNFDTMDHSIDAVTIQAKAQLEKQYDDCVKESQNMLEELQTHMYQVESDIAELKQELELQQFRLREYETVPPKKKKKEKKEKKNKKK